MTSEENGHEAQSEAEAALREIREAVADQLHDLVVERNGLGSLDEVAKRARQLVDVHRQVQEARGRQRQAEAFGNPLAPHVAAERAAKELLRQTVMSLGEACGSVAVGLDFERIRPRVESRA